MDTYYLGADSATDMNRTLIPTTSIIMYHCREKFILKIEKNKKNE